MSAVRSENKESSSSPCDGVLQAVLEERSKVAPRSRPGGREVKRSLPGGRRHRERDIWGDAAIVHAQVGVVKKCIRLHFYDR